MKTKIKEDRKKKKKVAEEREKKTANEWLGWLTS